MIKETASLANCLNCNRSETVTPLVSLRYAGDQAWICTQCLPMLIHQPEQIAHRLAGVDAGQTASTAGES